MNKILKFISLLSLTFGLFFNHASKPNVSHEGFALENRAFVESTYQGDYYDGIDPSSPSFVSDLRTLVLKNRCKTAYSAIWDYISYSDAAYPDSKTDFSVTAYYKGTPVSESSMNKEHVWPKSHGGNLFEGDPHMVRPTLNSDNNDRGNSFYVEGKNSKTSGWDPANYGVEQYRGDAARIIFYCALINQNVQLVDLDEHTTSNNNRDNMMGKLSDLLKWNEKYPVSETEKLRNDVLNGVRKSHDKTFNFNRNPFIDHPEWVEYIWGDGKPSVESNFNLQLYSTDGVDNTLISDSSLNLKIGDSVNLLAYANNEVSSDASWTITGDAVIHNWYGTNGKTITAVNEGTANVTIKQNYIDGGTTKVVSTSLDINVSNGSSSGGGTTATGDNLTAVNNNNDLVNDNVVVLKVDEDKGITGSNEKSDNALTSTTMSDWAIYKITDKDSSGFKLQNIKTNRYLLATSKKFQEDATGSKFDIYNGGLKSGSLFLYVNGSYIRFYASNSFPLVKVYKVENKTTETKTLTDLTYIGNCKTNYEKNEEFDPSGLTITATFTDGSTQDVTDSVVWVGDTSVSGQRTIVGKYTFGEVTKTIQIQITVAGAGPVNPIIDEEEEELDPVENPTTDLQGCSGSLIGTSNIILILLILPICLFLIKKKEIL